MACITTAEEYIYGLVGNDDQELSLTTPSSRHPNPLLCIRRVTATIVMQHSRGNCRWSDLEKLEVGSKSRQVVMALFHLALLFLKHSLKTVDLFCFFAHRDMERVVIGLF